MTGDGGRPGDDDAPESGTGQAPGAPGTPADRRGPAGSPGSPGVPGESATGPTVPVPPARAGRMRFQDETTTPREPTLAEKRAREQAARREHEARLAQEADQAARRKRKRLLIGAGVTVGVVALIAVSYTATNRDVEARCVDDDGVVADDNNCVTPAAGGYHGGGIYPLFIGSGGRQYHYNYGGSGGIGQRVSGGTTTVPDSSVRVRSGTSGRTLSGGSGSVSRGGFGVSGGDSRSGGS